MMQVPKRSLRNLGLLAGVLIAIAATAAPSRGQAVPTKDDIIGRLGQFDTGPELDITALRQRVLDRSRTRSRKEPQASKRPPAAPELLGLPGVNLDFDTDTPVVRPDSYETLGRLADALVKASLLPYAFLIVGHSDATGRREANVILSQRRADAIRDVLVNTFKISAKRLQSLGVGEEQFIDQQHPTSPVNLQIQVLTIAKMPEQAEPAGRTAAGPAPKPLKKAAKKR